ncbi:MAG: polyhydroxyalkanoate synthesis repressor PhaR [Siculibacillus sp.]|nr:polyhydroxyalkanoate synthesis repressor PhaR [Siculibacillus sp.]
MAKTEEPTIIKKYANRRLYNTGTSSYVTLEDLAEMVKNEELFVVYDAKSGDEITRSVLTQIIFEQENKGQNLLPITFLRQLIRFYGDSMQNLVPSYLEFSIDSLTREQGKFREQMSQAFPGNAFEAMEEQVRRNTEMFERAMRMFSPFGSILPDLGAAKTEEKTPEAAPAQPTELDRLKQQMEEMQKKLDAIAAAKS